MLTVRFFKETLPEIAADLAIAEADSGFALTPASIECLRRVARELPVRRAFEFGSGASTVTLLETGAEVFSLEDSQSWLDETAQRIPGKLGDRWRHQVAPLSLQWHRGAPFLGWTLTGEASSALGSADLVLIDSPAFPPFREYALIQALSAAQSEALIVLDDVRIPTLKRFCERVVSRNARISSLTCDVGHGLWFLAVASEGRLDLRRGSIETVKAWRRLWMAKRGSVPAQ